MSEQRFRYVSLARVQSYKILGWSKIGETLSPHDGNICAVMEWHGTGPATEPPEGECRTRTSRAAMC